MAIFFKKPCVFVKGCVDLDDLPPCDLPEIAFVGRSNVGKSSLINALLNNKGIARTSNTPGRTQEINFFCLDDALMLADLPGYGYARAAKVKIRSWNKLIRDYLQGRPCLRRVYLLIDSRHGIKDSDREIFTLLDEAAVSYQIILTKTDKINQTALESVLETVRMDQKKYIALHPDLLSTSSVKGDGIHELRDTIFEIL